MTAALGRDLQAQTKAPAAAPETRPAPPAARLTTKLAVNGKRQELTHDPRTTLLDALRDHLGLTGSKKGCDHGQCGAWTVLVNGVRMNSCLSLLAMRNGDEIVTIEGLAEGDALHPLQEAFWRHDGLQCGFCTPGQICSAVGMLKEIEHGVPSAVMASVSDAPSLNAAEVRERMSGNICRCSAYPNIVAAILDSQQSTDTQGGRPA
ncbi:MAG: 2Fe-2S iron-sulfur cluster-binding protein [Reyranellaceae bacterium]